MPSRLLTDLHPDVEKMAKKAIVGWRDAGLDVLITCTFRSAEEQAELYKIGRVPGFGKPGRVVTRARPGESSHNFRIDGRPASLAFDVVPLRLGKPVWGTKGNGIDDDPTDDDRDDLELWQRVARIAKAAGLTWYGEPTAEFQEFPHFQHPNAKAIRTGRAAA